MRRFLAVLATGLTILLPTAHAADVLSVRPWCELEPRVRIEPGEYPIPREKAANMILEEARVLFSGMVYGWTFVYTPGDKARRVAESFTLSPIAQIPWGSPRLDVREAEIEGHKLWSRAFYSLNDDESRRRSSWESNVASFSTGMGRASVMTGPPAKMDSLHDAIRDAIRNSLNARILNKPRQVTGTAVLWEDPQVTVLSGSYTTMAKVKLLVREIIPYRIF